LKKVDYSNIIFDFLSHYFSTAGDKPKTWDRRRGKVGINHYSINANVPKAHYNDEKCRLCHILREKPNGKNENRGERNLQKQLRYLPSKNDIGICFSFPMRDGAIFFRA
jgi:hypothetical protein